MKNDDSENKIDSPILVDPEKLKRREALKRMALAGAAAAGSLVVQGCKTVFSPYVDNYSNYSNYGNYSNYSVSYYNYSVSYYNYSVYYTNYYYYYTYYYYSYYYH